MQQHDLNEHRPADWPPVAQRCTNTADMFSATPAAAQPLPACPNGHGPLDFVADGYDTQGHCVYAGCHQCQALYQTRNGTIERQING